MLHSVCFTLCVSLCVPHSLTLCASLCVSHSVWQFGSQDGAAGEVPSNGVNIDELRDELADVRETVETLKQLQVSHTEREKIEREREGERG